MKDIYFLLSLPRAGNTILASVLNQNSRVKMTARSILCYFINEANKIYYSDKGQNFPDKDSYHNLIKGIFCSYYKNWKTSVIIDRGVWGDLKLLESLSKIIKPKFIILHRPLLECLASYIKIVKPVNDKNKPINSLFCDFLMQKNEIMGENLISIKNVLNSNYSYHVIKYDNFISNPQKEINNLCKFIKIKPHKINLQKIKQLTINNVSYDDSVVYYPFHKIKENIIEKTKYDFKKILGNDIINKYKEYEIKI
jgi:hypothetical protein